MGKRRTRRTKKIRKIGKKNNSRPRSRSRSNFGWFLKRSIRSLFTRKKKKQDEEFTGSTIYIPARRARELYGNKVPSNVIAFREGSKIPVLYD